MTMTTDLIAHLEQRGEATVRNALLNGEYGHPKSGNISYEHVKEWLSSKDYVRVAARSGESLSNSRKALRNSYWANIIAISAIVIAIATAYILRK
jgi:hypothetical protein